MTRGDGNVSYEHQQGTACRDDKQHRGCTGRWRGVVNRTVDGSRKRYVVDGPTKTEAARRLKAKVAELDKGVRPDGRYTVAMCVDDWLATLDRQADKTVRLYADMLRPVLAIFGTKALDKLSTTDVEAALRKMAQQHTSRAVEIAHSRLTKAIDRAIARDRVGRNVAAVAHRPAGQVNGRPSRAMAPAVAQQLVTWCEQEDSMIADYTLFALSIGCRPEEGRALTWDLVDLETGHVSLWRSVRAGGDTKTPKSRRTITVPPEVVAVLKRQQERQQQQREQAAELWQDTGLVFTTEAGGEIDSHDMNRRFKRLAQRAGIGQTWSIRELRHTFASLASANGHSIDTIAQMMGHVTSRTTEQVYRQAVRPVPVGAGVTAVTIGGRQTAGELSA